MYLLTIKHDKIPIINNTIAKYLLSLFYYKDIILSNKLSIDFTMIKELQDDLNHSENLNLDDKEEMNESNDDALDFNCKNEVKINSDERSFVQYAITAREGNVIAQYNLGCCYQYGMGINKDEKNEIC